jgi:hypothetical protein
MSTEALAARFQIFLKCENCRRRSCRTLDVPDVEDAPTGVDELVESAFLGRQVFACEVCDSTIATIVGINRSE